MALPATDTFTGTDNTILPTYSANWTNAASGMHILANRAHGIGSNAFNMAWWDADSFAAAHYAKGAYVGIPSAGDGPGVGVRCQSGAHSFYYAFCDNATCFAGQCITGGGTDWDSGHTVAINDIVELRIDETVTTTVRLYINTTLTATYTGKNALSGGAAGVGMYSNEINMGVDNWEGGDVSTAQVKQISPAQIKWQASTGVARITGAHTTRAYPRGMQRGMLRRELIPVG